jgi:acyl-CoA synthetase (AMP-forming)/AMP-acid ligase II
VPTALTLEQALHQAAAESDGLIFLDLREQERRLSWRDVLQQACAIAAGLRAAGIDARDRVAIMLPTGPDFVTAFFGCILAGAVPVPLYPPVRLGRLAEFVVTTTRMLKSVTAKLVVTDRSLMRLLGQVAERARPSLGFATLADLNLSATLPEIPPAAPQDLALIQFSSGTTRNPQPIALTHRNLTLQCAALKPLLRPTDDKTQLGVSWLPLYHDMGLIGSLLSAVTYPGSLVLIRPEHFLARPALWLRAISRYRATLSSAPAFAFPYCAHRIQDAELNNCDLSTWRLAICGAEPISMPALQRFCERFSVWGFDARALTPAYGLAEASLAVTCRPASTGSAATNVDLQHLTLGNQVESGSHPLISCGHPLAGMDLEVRDVPGRALPERHVGRIFVRGPTVMAGYFGQPEATSTMLHDGWLDTGDLGFFVNGELYVCGRLKDLIVIRGANHLPEEFEACLHEVSGVRRGRAMALGFQPPDAEGEALLLLVERDSRLDKNQPTDLERNIRRTIRQGTGIEPHSVLILAPGTLPRTSSGKLRRTEALRRYLSGELDAPGRTNALSLAGHLIRSSLSYTRLRLGR